MLSSRGNFLLPGILSRGEGFRALGFDAGDVVDYNAFESRGFNPYEIVLDVAAVIKMRLVDGLPVTLIGASLGGMMIPFIVEELRRLMPGAPLSGLRCVIIDAPFGVESMIAAGCSPFVGCVIRSPFGQLMRPLASIKIGPKDQYIEIPDNNTMREIAGETRTDAGWRAYVKRRAIEELSGHSSKQWLEELRWMTQVGLDGSLCRACKALSGVDATYLACLSAGNDVVQQPVAAMQWQRNTSGLRVVEVNAVHCGFLQQAPTFRGVLVKILG